MLKKINPILAPMALYAFKLYKKQKYKEAEKIFKVLVDKQPNNAYLNFRYGMVFYKMRRWKLAQTYIEKAIKIEPTNLSWQTQLNVVNNNLENKGQANYKEDLKVSKKALSSNVNDPNLILQYANSLLKTKKYWMAKFQYEKYLGLKPKSPKVLEKLGAISEKLSDFEKAVEYFQKASELSPDDLNLHYRIGYNLERLNKVDEAELYYDNVFTLSDGLREELNLFGIGAWHAKRGLWDLALSAYQRFAQENDSKNPELYYRIGVAYERQYLWEQAANSYEKAINLSEFIDANWCYKCGQSFERAKLLEKAVEYYQEAVNRSNDYNDYWYYRLSNVLRQKGDFELSAYYSQQSNRRQFAHAVAPKDVIKSREEDFLTFYTEYYETLKINDNLILIESFLGDSIACNPYALLRYLLENYKNFTYIIIIKENTVIPELLKFRRNVIFIKRNSDAYLRYLCSAKYLINNVSFPFYFIRKEGQIYLNTWHGTPTKHLGKDIKNPFMDFANVARNFLQATHIISPNRFTTNILLEKYNVKDLFNGKIAETGYPRVDLSFNLTAERKKEIIDDLGISTDKPVILYAPTWRGTSQSKNFDIEKLQFDLKKLKSDKYYLIFRGHHYTEQLLKSLKLNDIIIPPKNIDSNELLGICDLLITDYSSIAYDFLALNKPVISYIYDYEEYQKERGLYIDSSQMLGYVCKNIMEVKKLLKDVNALKNNISEETIKNYSSLDDGQAAKRVIDFIFNNDSPFEYKYQRKNSDIFFTGPFMPNGIARSFVNLISSIDKTSKNVVVFINVFDMAQNQKYIDVFNTLDLDNITVIPRVGRMPMTLEEIWVKEKFEKTYQLYSDDFAKTLIKIYKRELRRLLGNSSFDNAINFEGYALFYCLLFSQIAAKRRIIYQHNDMLREWNTKFPYMEGVFKTYQFYNTIVSVSEETMKNNMKNLSDKFYLNKEQFAYCNNPIDIEKIITSAEEELEMEEEFSSFDGKKLLNIGRMSHEKDQLKLIEAFSEAKKSYENMRLYIIGDGDLREDLRAKINSLKLENDVFLLGQKQNPFPYLKQSDAFVLSSNHEGQPMVLLEALTLNVPIVATNIVGNRSVLGDKYGILVENSKEGVKKGILQCLDAIDKAEYKDDFDVYSYQQEAINKFKTITNIG